LNVLGFFRFGGIFYKSETLLALGLDFLQHLLLTFILKIERINACYHEIQANCSRPNVDFISVSVFEVELRGRVIWHPDHLEISLSALYHLGKSKVCQEQLIFIKTDCFQSQVSVNNVLLMKFLDNLHQFGKDGKSIAHLKDLMLLLKLLLQKIGVNVVSNKVSSVVGLKLLNDAKDMGGCDEFFEDFEVVLIRHVHGGELVHEEWFVGLEGFEERTVFGYFFNELFFLVVLNHACFEQCAGSSNYKVSLAKCMNKKQE